MHVSAISKVSTRVPVQFAKRSDPGPFGHSSAPNYGSDVVDWLIRKAYAAGKGPSTRGQFVSSMTPSVIQILASAPKVSQTAPAPLYGAPDPWDVARIFALMQKARVAPDHRYAVLTKILKTVEN